MQNLHDILTRVEARARIEGTTPEKLCRKITGDPRLYERLKRRADKTEQVIKRLESYLKTCANRHVNQFGCDIPSVQEAAK